MSVDELAALIRVQKGQPDAIFHEVHLKRHRGVVDLETGLKAGHCPGLSKQMMRFRRDILIDHLDSHDRPFLSKIMDAFSMQYPFVPPADDLAQPYAEEEIWTAMGDVKYAFVRTDDGTVVKLPNVIREMAQDKFKFLNERIGDTLRELLRPHELEWNFTTESAMAYARMRAKQEKKLEQYQSSSDGKDYILLPWADYPYTPEEVLSKKNPPSLSISDVYSTMIQDRLYLMDKLTETTRSYEVQQKIRSTATGKNNWQTIPFPILAQMSESHILSLRDQGSLRIMFEQNPNKPAFRFAIRHFMENKMADLLTQNHRDFYTSETSVYVHGPSYIPDPEQHRIMSVAKIRLSIGKIQQNIRLGNGFFSASRDGESGAYDQFVNDNLAESILDNVAADTYRRERAYPLTSTRKMDFGVDPHTNEPVLNVKFQIPHDALKITIPDAHSAITATHTQYGHTCLVVPDVPQLRAAKHIILQEENTKRMFYAASPILHEMPSRHSGEYQRFYEQIDKAYTMSGKEPPDAGLVLSCEELAPVMRVNKRIYPSMRILQDKLIGTRNPQLANMQSEDVLTGFIVRKYDLRFANGQRILLRGVNANGEETGWEASAKIVAKPLEITLKGLLERLSDPKSGAEMEEMAKKCGYGTTDDMKAKMLSEFTKFDEDINHPQNILMFIEIAPVKKIAYWTHKQPRAAYESLGMVPPKIKYQKSRLAHKQSALDIS